MRNNLLIFLIFMCTCMGSRLQAQESPVKLAGMHGGLCVYFDATESQITEVVNSGSFLVHALQRDEKGVALIRKAISASGQAPLVSIDAWTTAPEIPYKRNHINLAVANSFSDLMKVGVTIEKLVEVLSPLGKACLGGIPESAQAKVEAELKAAGVSAMEWKGSWLVFQKPWLEGMGTWTHRQRGPDGNAVGNDTYLGVPNQIQWITSGSSSQTLVAGGRAFYVHRYSIVARDAGSGVLLWKTPIQYGTTLLVGDNLISTVRKKGDKQDRLAVISGKTGEIMRVLPSSGNLHAYENDIAIMENWSSFTAVRVSTGKKLWDIKYKREGPDAIAANRGLMGGRGNTPQFALLMKNGKVCMRRKNGEIMVMEADTGKVVWKKNLREELGQPFAMHFMFEDKVFMRTEKILQHVCDARMKMGVVGPLNKAKLTFFALSVKDGTIAWSHEFISMVKPTYRGQVYKAAGRIWVGHHEKLLPDDFTATDDPLKNGKKFGPYLVEPDPMVFDGLNLQTGKLEKVVTLPKQINFHCYQLTVTDRYHTGNRPYYFVSWETGEIEGRFGVVRSPCDGVGHFAAQGLFFARGKKGCGCIRTAMTAEGAFSASDDGTWDGAVSKPEHPLEKGPGKNPEAKSFAETDWPTLRGDAQRSGVSKASIADELKQKWHFKSQRGEAWLNSIIATDWKRSNFLGKKSVSQPVIAYNTAFVSQLENKCISAIDVVTGREKWSSYLPARVDAPPTIYKGLALVGCADGWVYALRADNGERVYRLRIAPAERRIVAYGQLESSWPVVGGVLVVDDMAYAVAGRTTEVDGGLYVVGFDAATGAFAWEGRRYLNNPGNIGRADHKRMTDYGTGAADVLSSDGKVIAIGTRTQKSNCFNAKTGKNGGKYSAVPYSTPLQSTKHKSIISVVDGKQYTAAGPTYHKLKKGETVRRVNKPGSIFMLKGWRISTEDASAVAISTGADRLAVALSKEGQSELWILSRADGKKLAGYPLPSKPTQDGVAIAKDLVLVTLEDGSVVAFGK